MNNRLEKMNLNSEALVREYLKSGSQIIKEKVVTAYSPLVKYVVGRLNVAPTATLRRDDLYQIGVIGLLESLERFKPEIGVQFKTFAYKRIHGKIVDELRKEGIISRDKFDKVKLLERTVQELSSELGREPSMFELCDKMDIDEDEYYTILDATQINYMISLDAPVYDEDGESLNRIDTLEDTSQMSAEETVLQDNMKTAVKRIIQELPERQRIILALYFYEELTLFDIGQVLGLTEARVSQILNETLLHVKSKIR